MKVTNRNTLLGAQLQELNKNPMISDGHLVIGDNFLSLRAKFKASTILQYETTKIKLVDVNFELATVRTTMPDMGSKFSVIEDANLNENTLTGSDLILNHNQQLSKPVDQLTEVLKQHSSPLLQKVNQFNKEMSLSFEKYTALSIDSKIKDGIQTYHVFNGLGIPEGEQQDADLNENPLDTANFDVLLKYIHFDQSLSVDNAKTYHNYIFRDLPVLSTQPIFNQESIKPEVENTANLLLSRTYSTNHEQTSQLLNNISAKLSVCHYKDDILTFFTLGIAQGKEYPNVKHISHSPQDDGTALNVERHDPLTILHATNDDELREYTYFSNNPDIGGFYSPEYNSLVFVDGRSFIHEATHAVINMLFKNQCHPYPEAQGPVYEEYQDAKKDLLIKIIKGLGFKSDIDLQEEYISALIYTLKKYTILDLFYYNSDPFKMESEKTYLANKYFPGQVLEDFAKSFTELVNYHRKELSLTDSENKLFSEIALLFHSSAYEDQKVLDAEIIVRLPQLVYQGVDTHTMHQYFGKMEQFWDKYVHAPITTLIEEHTTFCSTDGICPANPLHTLFMPSFDQCVAELL